MEYINEETFRIIYRSAVIAGVITIASYWYFKIKETK